jgi:hypothetical protein
MERFFLALMVSGLLLAVVAASLFVATGADDRRVSVMNLPPPPSAYLKKTKPHEGQKTGNEIGKETGKEAVGRH